MKTKQIVLWMLALLLVVTACGQAANAGPAAVLKVSGGEVEKSYTAADLEKLGAAKAAVKGVEYTGVLRSVLLADAGFDPGQVKEVVAESSDGFTAAYDPELINREDTLVAYALVDGPMSADDGSFRMVLPDQAGKLNPRQVVEIKVTP